MTTTEIRQAGRREWIGLAVLALACLLYVMDLTVLHLAVPSISEDLKPSSAQLLWIIDIYGFMVAGFLITMGTLGDRIGRRKLLLIGAAAFGALSLLAAFSTSPEMLIVSRALLGIAGATLAPSTLSLIFSMFQDPRQRAVAIGVWISAFSAGSAIGPVLGGILLEHFWWGSVFLLALPVMALLLVLGPIVLPEYRDPDAGRLDLASAAHVAGRGPGRDLRAQADRPGRRSGSLPVASIARRARSSGACSSAASSRLADPMIDLRLFRIPAFSASLAINFLAIFVAVGYFLFVAQYLQLVVGLSPLEAGLWSLPSAIGFIVGSNLAPRIVQPGPAGLRHGRGPGARGGRARRADPGGRLGRPRGRRRRFDHHLAGPRRRCFALTTELIVGSAPPERAGAASGISETGAELGGALGISILGSIGVAIYRGDMADGLPAGVPAEAADVARDTLGGAVGVARTAARSARHGRARGRSGGLRPGDAGGRRRSAPSWRSPSPSSRSSSCAT